MRIEHLLGKTPIIPVVTIENADDALPLAEALLEGGISVIEVTLRTPQSMLAIKKIAHHLPKMLVGTGTILTPQLLQQAQDHGSQFFISPGFTNELAEFAQKNNLCFIPGVTSPSEVMRAMKYDLTLLKFFPAEISGGINALQSFLPLFPNMKFCPTGGINLKNMNDYLHLNNVICVGGSWLTPAELIKNKDWKVIAQIAKTALSKVNN